MSQAVKASSSNARRVSKPKPTAVLRLTTSSTTTTYDLPRHWVPFSRTNLTLEDCETVECFELLVQFLRVCGTVQDAGQLNMGGLPRAIARLKSPDWSVLLTPCGSGEAIKPLTEFMTQLSVEHAASLCRTALRLSALCPAPRVKGKKKKKPDEAESSAAEPAAPPAIPDEVDSKELEDELTQAPMHAMEFLERLIAMYFALKIQSLPIAAWSTLK